MQTTKEKLKEIKQSFRQYMNGITSSSMRQKGVNYKVNWGVNLSDLRELAKKYGKDEDLAFALWKENIRECKILATLIMPIEVMNQDKAEEWIKEIPTQELAELLAFHLFQHIGGVEQLTLHWLQMEEPLCRVCAYHTLSNKFKQSVTLSEQDKELFLQHILKSLKSKHAGERHAALNALNHFANINEEYEILAQTLLEQWEKEFF